VNQVDFCALTCSTHARRILGAMQLVLSALIGLTAGVLSGVFGIGGGIIVVPALVLLVGLNQHTATGTSLAALLLPVGILGVLTYYRSNAVNLPVAGLLAAGIVVGTALGARLGLSLPEVLLRRLLAGLMIVVAVQLLLKR
jgi:uncharacterized membrane protein YfcA